MPHAKVAPPAEEAAAAAPAMEEPAAAPVGNGAADAVTRLHRGGATGGAAAEARSYDAALALEALRRLDAPPRRAGQSRAAASRAETRARGKLALAAGYRETQLFKNRQRSTELL